MKYKLTKKVKQEIRELASTLPEVALGGNNYCQVKNLSDAVLIYSARQKERTIVPIDTRSKAISVLGTTENGYMSAPIIMNHYKNMRKLYKKGGDQSVLEYASKFAKKAAKK